MKVRSLSVMVGNGGSNLMFIILVFMGQPRMSLMASHCMLYDVLGSTY